MGEMQQIAALITGSAAAAGVIWKVWKKVGAVIEGIRCQLRTDMMRTYYRHREEKKIRQYEMENFEHNYAAYTALGGNSFIGTIHEEVIGWEVIS